MRYSSIATLAFGLFIGVAGCAGSDDTELTGDSESEIRTVRTFTAKGTGYFPDASPMEGGFVDRKGKRLRTLQQFVAGNAEYVSVAMDTKAFPYGQRLRIREFNAKFGKEIIFRVVDTGGAFKGKGTTRIDICTANRKASLDPTVNGKLTIEVIDEKSGPPEVPPASEDPGPPAAPPEPVEDDPAGVSAQGGAACRSHGACNPGNDGAGLICVENRCVPGCEKDYHCPGVKKCQAGQCR